MKPVILVATTLMLSGIGLATDCAGFGCGIGNTGTHYISRAGL
jgi:hypothetical protein